MKIEKAKGVFVETDALSVTEINTLMDDLQREIDKMDIKLTEVKAKARTQREFADPDWYRRLQFALKVMRREKQKLAWALGERTKAEKREEHQLLAVSFVSCAKKVLADETFALILSMARNEVKRNVHEDESVAPRKNSSPGVST